MTEHGSLWQPDAPLAKYTASRLGGNAEWLYVASSDDAVEMLTDVVQSAWHDGLDVRVIGQGANMLVSDHGVPGLVLVNRAANIAITEQNDDGATLRVQSGTGLLRLARFAQEYGLAGMEWLVGVPGTLGGAVVNNAGAHGADMSDSVVEVTVLDRAEGVQTWSLADLTYDYRHSALKSRTERDFVVLEGLLRLPADDAQEIQNRMDEFSARRKATQPPGASLGSIFKNPPGDYAGRLIDVAGLKGVRVGDIEVSSVHANFFVNHGNGTATEYSALIDLVQETVNQRFGVTLELEIERVGRW